jgi:hypothetical protein
LLLVDRRRNVRWKQHLGRPLRECRSLGTRPKWRADGKELIFQAPNGSPSLTLQMLSTGQAASRTIA